MTDQYSENSKGLELARYWLGFNSSYLGDLEEEY